MNLQKLVIYSKNVSVKFHFHIVKDIDIPQYLPLTANVFRSSPARFIVVLWPEISLEGSSFANDKPTVFITHGFANNGNNTWVAEMKDNYLKRVYIIATEYVCINIPLK